MQKIAAFAVAAAGFVAPAASVKVGSYTEASYNQFICTYR